MPSHTCTNIYQDTTYTAATSVNFLTSGPFITNSLDNSIADYQSTTPMSLTFTISNCAGNHVSNDRMSHALFTVRYANGDPSNNPRPLSLYVNGVL